ncbi:MAG: hypothetical protein M1831_004050, partial [Alyxoria varia]
EHAGTRRKLDKAEDDIEALKVQIERMTGQLQQQQQQQQNGQNNSYTGGAFDPWARSASSSSLAPIGANATKAPILSTAAARELARTELAASNWDYNAILERYKSGAALPSSAPPSTNAPNPSNQSNAGFPQQQQQQSPPNNGGWTSPPPFPQASGTTVGAAGQWVQPVAPSMSQPPSNQAPQTFSSPFGRPNSGGIHQQNSSGTNSANNGTPRMGNPSRGMSGNSGMINRTPSNPHPLPPSTGPTPPQSTIHKTSYAPPHQQQQQRNFYNQSHHHQQGAPVDAGFLMNAGGQRISATGVVNTASGAGPGDGDVDMG